MKMKCAAAILTSLGLMAMAASLRAQQDVQKTSSRSADVAPEVTEKQAYSEITGADPKQVQTKTAPRPAENYQRAKGADSYAAPNPGYYVTSEWKKTAENPELSQLSMQESTLAKQADMLKHRLDGATTDAERSEIRTKLAAILGNQFDLRQKRHGLEIEALETQVRKLRELVRKRQESREEIISRRVEQIVREAEGLGW